MHGQVDFRAEDVDFDRHANQSRNFKRFYGVDETVDHRGGRCRNISGNVIRSIVEELPDPQVAEDSSSEGSIERRAPANNRNITGTWRNLATKIIPYMEWISRATGSDQES